MDFYAIGDESMILGLGLVGIPGKVVSNGQEALTEVKEKIKQNVKIILISERITASIQSEIEEIILKMDFPLLIEIPDRQGSVEGKKTIKDILKSSLGFSL